MKDQQVLSMTDAGLGCRKIAETLGCHKSTVQKILKHHGRARGSLPVVDGTHGLSDGFQQEGLSKAAEHYARFLLLARGLEVMVPTAGDCPFDLLVQMNGKFKKVQVKASYSPAQGSDDGYRFGLRRTRCNATSTKSDLYTAEECDYFMLVDMETRAWFIPFSLVEGVCQITPLNRFSSFRVPGT